MWSPTRRQSFTGSVWSAKVGSGCHFARRMPSGITRVSLYSTKQVVEIDRAGKTRRRTRVNAQPFMSQLLESGNLLVCYPQRGAIAEVKQNGKEVRRWSGYVWPTSAYRLPGGELIIGDRRGVHRVDATGKRKTLHAAVGIIWIAYY